MKAKHIALILIPLNIILAYFLFNSIDSEVGFQKAAKERIAENEQKLEDLRQVQLKYKQVKGVYADHLDSLRIFLENGSIAFVKAKEIKGDTIIDGETLTSAQALALGFMIQDTTYALAKDSVFDSHYLKKRDKKYPLPTSSTLSNIPNSNEKYTIYAGSLTVNEDENVTIQTFEISTTYEAIFTGLDTKSKTKKELDTWIGIYEDASTADLKRNGN